MSYNENPELNIYREVLSIAPATGVGHVLNLTLICGHRQRSKVRSVVVGNRVKCTSCENRSPTRAIGVRHEVRETTKPREVASNAKCYLHPASRYTR